MLVAGDHARLCGFGHARDDVYSPHPTLSMPAPVGHGPDVERVGLVLADWLRGRPAITPAERAGVTDDRVLRRLLAEMTTDPRQRPTAAEVERRLTAMRS